MKSPEIEALDSQGTKPDMGQYSGKLRQQIATIDMSEMTVEDGDTVEIARIPAHARLHGVIVSNSVSLATSTIAIGTAAAAGLLFAAATKTTTTALLSAPAAAIGHRTTEQTPIFLTVGEANLPTTGMLKIVVLYAKD